MKTAAALLATLLLPSAIAPAQTPPVSRPDNTVIETLYLNNISAPNEANEVTTGLRNLLDPKDKIYLVPAQNAIVVDAPPDQIALARKLLKDLDRPRKTYRLGYTITEMDNGKSIGTQHFGVIVVAGGRTTLKQGSKVPVATGTFNSGNTGAQTQFTYLDVGLNIDSSVDESLDGLRLRSKVEQSSLSEEKSSLGPQDPIVRQTVMEGTSILTLGKPLILGSLDIPGSTRHLDISVVLGLVR